MQTKLTLNDGNVIPQFGLGLYQLPEGTETQNIVKTALELGYRHLDTQGHTLIKMKNFCRISNFRLRKSQKFEI
ncbi:putative oxidoreductase/MSMEI_2347 [Lactococcus lactis]|uniref:hypothetical protein n=1 Tax=Lactococcus lactis TaxID=1358 RepID=UPI0028FD8647|nr:hypothetical protein [Lactococcus lactis]MDU0401472.1 putative oxidoreductase/MSMEI_2347 [Lactococcus lactis]